MTRVYRRDTDFDFEPRRDMEHEIDGWIEQLSQCKQLAETDVKKLCDKVRLCPQTRHTL